MRQYLTCMMSGRKGIKEAGALPAVGQRSLRQIPSGALFSTSPKNSTVHKTQFQVAAGKIQVRLGTDKYGNHCLHCSHLTFNAVGSSLAFRPPSSSRAYHHRPLGTTHINRIHQPSKLPGCLPVTLGSAVNNAVCLITGMEYVVNNTC